jgi:hypothetical protein
MLAEIARKREEREQARAERQRRQTEEGSAPHDQSDRGAGI